MSAGWFYRAMFAAESCACASCADDRGWGLCLRWNPIGGETKRKVLGSRWLRYHSSHGFDERDVAAMRAEFPDAWLLPSDKTDQPTEKELAGSSK